MGEQVPKNEESAFKRYLATGKHWPILLVVLFVTQASIVVGTAIIASGHGSKPIDEEYYAKSLEWDSQRAVQRRADELGWTIEATIGDEGDALGQRPVTITLNDADGNPMTDAMVNVGMFHRSRSDLRIEGVFAPVSEGVYSKPMAVGRSGLWDVQIKIRVGGEVAEVTRVVEVGE